MNLNQPYQFQPPQQPMTSELEFQSEQFQPASPSGGQPNKNLWIYLLIVLVISGGAFGFYVWQKGGFLPALPSPTVSPTSTPDPFSGWQTYRNEEYGFEFRYPRDQQIIIQSYSLNNIAVCNTDKRNCSFGLDYYDSLYALTGNQADAQGLLVSSLEEYIESRHWTQVFQANLSGASGLCGQHILPNESVVLDCIYEYRGFYYYIPGSGNFEITDQILSTFRFIE